jgi:hypothetical protein
MSDMKVMKMLRTGSGGLVADAAVPDDAVRTTEGGQHTEAPSITISYDKPEQLIGSLKDYPLV